MVINRPLNFFFKRIEDYRTISKYYPIKFTYARKFSPHLSNFLEIIEKNWENLEKKIDSFFAESRYWLDGKKIKLYNDYFEVIEEKRDFKNTQEKIISIAIAILCFIPGVILKSLLWLIIKPHIDGRYKKFFDLSNQQQNFSPAKLLKFSLNFDSFDDQNASLFSQQPDAINHRIIDFLDDKNKHRLANCCKKLYFKSSRYKIDIKDVYPKVIVNALGKSFLEGLTQGVLPNQCHNILYKAELLSEQLDNNEDLLVKEASEDVFSLTYYLGNDLDDLINTMGNQSIQSLITPRGRGLMIRLQNNLAAKHNKVQLVILLKLHNKWIGVCFRTSGGTWALWNNLRFYDDDPVLEEYLKRLKEGKPCGCFPKTLNDSKVIYYKTTKASDVLVEGPRVCPDGITPVIQLWKPPLNSSV